MRRAAAVTVGGVLLTLIAFTFDSSPLFVPGIAFTLIGLAVPAWISASARGCTVRRQLHAERVTEDEPLEATIEVMRGPLGVPGGEIHDPLAGEPVSLLETRSIAGGSRTIRLQVIARFPRRGHRLVPAPELVVQDPLALARAVRAASTPAQELLVLPRIEPVRWRAGARREHSWLAGAATPSEPIAAADIDGLRPYRRGTPASRIHWPAVARGAGLLERRLQPDGDAQPMVVLDARGSGPAEDLDAAVRAASSLTLQLARRGGCALLLPGERRAIAIAPDLAAWPAAHARLALIAGGPGTPPPLLGRAARPGPIVYVAPAALERLPSGLGERARRAGCVLVVPEHLLPPVAGRPAFTVAGCAGFALRSRHRLQANPQGAAA